MDALLIQREDQKIKHRLALAGVKVCDVKIHSLSLAKLDADFNNSQRFQLRLAWNNKFNVSCRSPITKLDPMVKSRREQGTGPA